MAPPTSRNSASGTGVGAGGWGDAPLARALFAYLSSGENQLSFLEGDLIALMGESDLATFVDKVHTMFRNYGNYSCRVEYEARGSTTNNGINF